MKHLLLMTLTTLALPSCYAGGGYAYGYRSGYYVAPVYYEPGPYYRPALAACAFVDICPSGVRRCCFDVNGYPVRVLP